MDLYRGRLIDHVHLRARDLAASRRFYAAILEVLGIPVVSDEPRSADKSSIFPDRLTTRKGQPVRAE